MSGPSDGGTVPTATVALEDDAGALPPYPSSQPATSAPRLVTHSYWLQKRDHKWLTLNVQSRASSPDQFPAVIGDRPVQGNVIFDPKDQKEPKSITVKVSPSLPLSAVYITLAS